MKSSSSKHIDLKAGQFFKPRYNKRPMWVFLILFLFLSLIFLFVLLRSEYDSNAYAAMFVLVFCLGLILYLFFNSTPFTTKYWVGKEGIYLQKRWLKRLVPFHKLKAFHVFEEGDAAGITNEYDHILESLNSNMSAAKGLSLEMRDLVQKQSEISQITQFASVPFIQFAKGGGRFIRPSKTNANGRFIYLETEKELQYLISPEDIEGFIKEVARHY